MSRNRTVERRKERERQKQQQRQITLIGGIVVVAVVAAVLLVLANQPAEAPIPAEAAARYEGIPQSQTDSGFPRLGSPEAPIQVVEYSSYSCPGCKVFHDNVVKAPSGLLDRIRAGEVLFTYVPMSSTGSFTNGQGAARAAVCVGEQGRYWEFHDALFEWQGIYGNQAFANNRIEAGIDALPIDRAQWDACMASELPNQVTRAAEQAAQALPGFQGTPTVTINGIIVQPDLASVTRAIEQELAKRPVVQPAAETTPETSAEATPETAPAETTPEAEVTPETGAEMTPEAAEATPELAPAETTPEATAAP